MSALPSSPSPSTPPRWLLPCVIAAVAATAAQRGDINIVQTALGTAMALRTVTVKPRVDGQLKDILFTEGALVKQGQAIAQIDPVPLQVAPAQASAADLENAQLLGRRLAATVALIRALGGAW